MRCEERITAAVGDLLAATTAGRPTIVCVEDIHWADPSSVALVRSLAEAPALAHVLFVLTTRPDLSAASAWIDVVAQIDGGRRIVDLAPLSGQDSRSLLGQAFADGSSSTLIDEIGAKADGNPLYLASFLRSLMESGLATLSDGRVAVDAPLAALAIPDTVQAVLGSQIDRLPALGKEVLQWAAILGNTFRAQRCRRDGCCGQGWCMASRRCCRCYASASMLVTDSDDRLRFVHALLRDVGYEQMLERERRRPSRPSRPASSKNRSPA
jgi:predicted ATPase